MPGARVLGQVPAGFTRPGVSGVGGSTGGGAGQLGPPKGLLAPKAPGAALASSKARGSQSGKDIRFQTIHGKSLFVARHKLRLLLEAPSCLVPAV